MYGVNEEGEALQLKYHAELQPALRSLFNLHLLHCPFSLTKQDCRTFTEIIQKSCNVNITVYHAHKGSLKTVILPAAENKQTLSFPLLFLVHRNQLHLISEVNRVNKCPDCGSYFKAAHTCNTRRRDFYFHHISAQSSDWWEEITFFPLGACPTTRRLFVTYDVETYTWHGQFGKQLMPFMLVFTVFGDEHLTRLAVELAAAQGWCTWAKAPNTFFYLNPQKHSVGSLFKRYRDGLQQLVIGFMWQRFNAANPQLDKYRQEHHLMSTSEITFQELCQLKLSGSPEFVEVYIVGHNINGFDEIVLAAQVINNKADIPTPFKVTRNFMPRCGKILFNDLTFALPNPSYKKRTDYAAWEQGSPEVADFKYQFAKFMVRDTFALTHTSLRNAARAYALPVEKGCCPYRAVNEFYMLGTYRQDEDTFPAAEYWSSEEEYQLNKSLWLQKKEDAYDIIQHTLDYCALDVLVTAQLVQRLRESYRTFISDSVHLPGCDFNIFQRPTISSNSHAIFRQILYRRERPQKASLGHIVLAPSNEMYAYIRESIRGGRCYPTYIGVLEEPIFVYDICGMYASALTHPFPSGKPLNPFDRALAVRTWEERLSKRAPIDYFDGGLLPAVFTVDADPPEERYLDVLPPFCSKKGGRLCWTNESLRGEVATSIDVITLHNRGWTVRLLPDVRTTVFPQWKCLAKEYVQLNIAAKEKADRDKNQTLRSISKLLSNSLYGSFATKLDNKVTVFSDQMEEKYVKGIAAGNYNIKATSFIETDNLSATVVPEFVVAYSPVREQLSDTTCHRKNTPNSDTSEDEGAPFYSPPDAEGHVTYTYKPITFLDADESAMCLHTLENNSPLVFNNRYPSHIASFVLAWTRAFISEWAEFLFAEDRGLPLDRRTLKFVYGDTDSMFLTEAGKKLMDSNGRHRLKGPGKPLVFSPDSPRLTWLVECETRCPRCDGDAYSDQNVFLAPKLYALKSITCATCGASGPGKLRAKGHATSQLSYELLTSCCYSDAQRGSEKFSTSRLSLKKSLVNNQPRTQPFTVVESTLVRTLRPWKDLTLRPLDPHRLVPYSNSSPNPRNTELCWMEIPWSTSPSCGTGAP